MENTQITSYIENIIDSYSEPVQRVDGLVRNPKEIIKTIEFYTNSQFMSGNTDSLGREKPFYNICNFRVTTAKTATDLDVKDIKFEPDSLKFADEAMLINHELYKYLKEINFSKTLNDMGTTRPKYGGVLVKKTESKNTLNIEVVDWTNVDFDPNDVIGSPLIETFYLQPSELQKKVGIWENIDEFITAHNKYHKNKPVKLEVKEITGEFPMSMYPDAKETDTGYARMCFYIGYVNKKKFILYYELEKDNKYKYLPWEAVGNGLGRGVVEDGFQAQVWTNDSIISMKNALDLSGKIVLYTDSQKVSGNILTDVDSGHIFEIERGTSVAPINLSATALPQIQNMVELWKQQYNNVASTYDANTGESPTAGTPYSQTALLNQVANTPFEYRREEWGIFLNEILNDWILPFLKKRITKEHYLVSEFSNEDLDKIDEAIANDSVNSEIVKMLSSDAEVTPETQQILTNSVKNNLKKKGNKREIKIPEGYLDVEGNLTANITGELNSKGVILQSLDSIFKTVVSTYNPNTGEYGALQDPVLSKIFGQIIEMSGVPLSSVQLGTSKMNTQPVAQPDLSAIQQQA